MEEVEGLMVTIIVDCPAEVAKISCVMVERPMESRNIAVEHASDKAAKIRHRTPIQKNVEKRFSKRIKSEVVYVDLSERLGFHVIQ